MIEFYPQIKWVHVAAVIASGSLFLVRGLAVQARAGWGMATPIRYLSYSIDTVLLAAGLILVTILPGALFASGWLTVKLVLLVFYIGLGTFALKRARRASVRVATFIGALAVYGTIVAIARTHDPRGPLLWLAT